MMIIYLKIINYTFKKKIIQDLYEKGLNEHFDKYKTITSAEGIYFLPQLKRDIDNFIIKCLIYQTIKGRS